MGCEALSSDEGGCYFPLSDYCMEASIVSDLVTCIVKVDRPEKSIFKACYNVAYGYCQPLLRRTISDGVFKCCLYGHDVYVLVSNVYV